MNNDVELVKKQLEYGDRNTICECCGHKLKLHTPLVEDRETAMNREFQRKVTEQMMQQIPGMLYHDVGSHENPIHPQMQQWCCHKVSVEGHSLYNVCPCNMFIPVDKEKEEEK